MAWVMVTQTTISTKIRSFSGSFNKIARQTSPAAAGRLQALVCCTGLNTGPAQYRAGSIQAVSIQASIQGPQYRAVSIQAPLDRRPPAAPDGQTSPSPARLLLQDVNADVLWSLSQQQPLDRRPPATLMGTPPPPLQECVYKILLRISSSFFSTSPGVRSSSSAMLRCLAAGSCAQGGEG